MNTTRHAITLISTASNLFAMHGLRSALADSHPSAVAAPAPAKTANSVRIDNFRFEPRELKVAVGETVTWQNADDVPHTVTSTGNPQLLDSAAIDTDDKFSFTFTKPGKYPYYCKVHPHMTAVVIVK